VPTALSPIIAPVKVFLKYKDGSYWQMETSYAVASPQYPGVYQIAFRIPPDALVENASIVLQVGEVFAENSETNPDTLFLTK